MAETSKPFGAKTFEEIDAENKARMKAEDDKAAAEKTAAGSMKASEGVRTEPSAAEDKKAKAEAKATQEAVEDARKSTPQGAADLASEKAIAEGNSVLGKEAVVVQDAHGNPVVSRRGPAGKDRNASATNPELVANVHPKDTPLHG